MRSGRRFEAVDDAAVVAGVLANDPHLRTELFDRYAPYVGRVLSRILGADDEIPDLIHDVFVLALRDLRNLRDPNALKGWLASLAVHTARGYIRRRTRRRWLRFFAPDDLPETPVPPGDDEREALRAFYAILSHVDADDRIAFTLRVIGGMEIAEVAAATSTSESTVKRRVNRAKAFVAGAVRDDPALQPWVDGGAE